MFILCSYNCLYFFGVGCDLSSFIHDFIYLGSFSFLFDKSGKGFINLINSFKEPAPTIVDLFYCLLVVVVGFLWFLFLCFFVSLSLISALIFIIPLLLLGLGFPCCSFCNSFRCRVMLCIWDLREKRGCTRLSLCSPGANLGMVQHAAPREEKEPLALWSGKGREAG